MPDLDRVAGNLRAELPQQELRESSGGHARSGLASRGTLEDIASIVKIEFLRARQIGVTGTGSQKFSFVVRRVGGSFDWQYLFPVSPVAVFDAQGDGCADGLSVAHAGKYICAIFFDFLPAATPVAELPAVQFVIDEAQIHRH